MGAAGSVASKKAPDTSIVAAPLVDPRTVLPTAAAATVNATPSDSPELTHRKRTLLRSLEQLERAGWRLSRRFSEADSVRALSAELDRVLTAEAEDRVATAPAPSSARAAGPSAAAQGEPHYFDEEAYDLRLAIAASKRDHHARPAAVESNEWGGTDGGDDELARALEMSRRESAASGVVGSSRTREPPVRHTSFISAAEREQIELALAISMSAAAAVAEATPPATTNVRGDDDNVAASPSPRSASRFRSDVAAYDDGSEGGALAAALSLSAVHNRATIGDEVAELLVELIPLSAGVGAEAREAEALCATTLATHPVSVERVDADGATLLMLACRSGVDEAITRMLLEKGSDPDAIDPRGRSALHFACLPVDERARARQRGGGTAAVWRTVELLLAYGADPTAADAEGQTALHHAAAEGHVPLIEALLQAVETTGLGSNAHAMAKMLDSRGRTPMQCAVECNQWGAVELLNTRTGLRLATEQHVHVTEVQHVTTVVARDGDGGAAAAAAAELERKLRAMEAAVDSERARRIAAEANAARTERDAAESLVARLTRFLSAGDFESRSRRFIAEQAAAWQVEAAACANDAASGEGGGFVAGGGFSLAQHSHWSRYRRFVDAMVGDVLGDDDDLDQKNDAGRNLQVVLKLLDDAIETTAGEEGEGSARVALLALLATRLEAYASFMAYAALIADVASRAEEDKNSAAAAREQERKLHESLAQLSSLVNTSEAELAALRASDDHMSSKVAELSSELQFERTAKQRTEAALAELHAERERQRDMETAMASTEKLLVEERAAAVQRDAEHAAAVAALEQAHFAAVSSASKTADEGANAASAKQEALRVRELDETKKNVRKQRALVEKLSAEVAAHREEKQREAERVLTLERASAAATMAQAEMVEEHRYERSRNEMLAQQKRDAMDLLRKNNAEKREREERLRELETILGAHLTAAAETRRLMEEKEGIVSKLRQREEERRKIDAAQADAAATLRESHDDAQRRLRETHAHLTAQLDEREEAITSWRDEATARKRELATLQGQHDAVVARSDESASRLADREALLVSLQSEYEDKEAAQRARLAELGAALSAQRDEATRAHAERERFEGSATKSSAEARANARLLEHERAQARQLHDELAKTREALANLEARQMVITHTDDVKEMQAQIDVEREARMHALERRKRDRRRSRRSGSRGSSRDGGTRSSSSSSLASLSSMPSLPGMSSVAAPGYSGAGGGYSDGREDEKQEEARLSVLLSERHELAGKIQELRAVVEEEEEATVVGSSSNSVPPSSSPPARRQPSVNGAGSGAASTSAAELEAARQAHAGEVRQMKAQLAAALKEQKRKSSQLSKLRRKAKRAADAAFDEGKALAAAEYAALLAAQQDSAAPVVAQLPSHSTATVNVVHGAGVGDRGGASAKIVCHFVNRGGGQKLGRAPVARSSGSSARVELMVKAYADDDSDDDASMSGVDGDVRGAVVTALLPAFVDFDVVVSGGSSDVCGENSGSALASTLVAQLAPLVRDVSQGTNTVLVSSPMCHWAGEEMFGGYLHKLLAPELFSSGDVLATVACQELADGGETVVDLVRDQSAAWGGGSSSTHDDVSLTQRECGSFGEVKEWLRSATKRANKRAVARLFEVVITNRGSGVSGRLALMQLAPLRDDSNSMQALDAAMSSTIRAINRERDGRSLHGDSSTRRGGLGRRCGSSRSPIAALMTDVISGAAQTVWVLHLDPFAPRSRVGKALQRVQALRAATGGNDLAALQRYGGGSGDGGSGGDGGGTLAMQQMRQKIDAMKRR